MAQFHKDVDNAIEADSRDLLDECLKKYSEEDFQNMNINGLSVTHRACSKRKLNCIRLLAEKGETVPWIQHEFLEMAPGGKTALHYALKGYPRPGKKPKIGKKKKAKRRQIEKEFQMLFTEILEIFRLFGLPVNQQNSEGLTVLQLMVQSKKYLIGIKDMLSYGGDAMVLDKNRNNILHLAAKTGIPEAFGDCLACLDPDTKILLLTQKNKSEKTPIQTFENSTAPKHEKAQYKTYLESLIEAKRMSEEERAKF